MSNGGTRPLNRPPGPSDHAFPVEGATLGRYEQLTKIGEGGMGRVYRAFDAKLRRTVALKICHPRHASVPGQDERFRREAQILARLDLPDVVKVFDQDVYDGWHFYAMQHVQGWSLHELATKGGLSLDKRLALLLPIARIIASLHANEPPVCHRDLKPDNIVVRADGRPILIDFGVARLFAPDLDVRLTRADILIGTLCYISPESPRELHDNPRAALAADVYSLGVVFYELLAKRLPYDIENLDVGEILQVVREVEPVPLRDRVPEVPPAVAAIVHRMLGKPWTSRPTAAEVVAALGGEARPSRPVPHRRALALVATLGGAALLAAGIGIAVLNRTPPVTEPSLEPAPSTAMVEVATPPAPAEAGAASGQAEVGPMPLVPSREPTVYRNEAPPVLADAWRSLRSDARLVGRGSLLWELPVGTIGTIWRDDSPVAAIDCRESAQGQFHDRPGGRLTIVLQLPNRPEPWRADWLPVAGQVDTLY